MTAGPLEELTAATPACELYTRPHAGGGTFGRIGVAVGADSNATVFPIPLNERTLAKGREAYGETWDPVTGPYGDPWSLTDCSLTIGQWEVSAEADGMLMLDDRNLVLSLYRGGALTGATGDGRPTYGDLSQGPNAVVIRWPLTGIGVVRTLKLKKVMRWWDAALTVRGDDAGLVVQGVSFWGEDGDRPHPQESAMRALGMVIADRVSRAGKEASGWQREADRKAEEFTIAFTKSEAASGSR